MVLGCILGAVAVTVALLCTNGSVASAATKKVKIAYMSYAVANSYDAPMLAGAQAVAKKDGATLKVFDANNDASTQLDQLQTVVSSGQYNAIITDPVNSLNLITTVKQAIKSGIKVVNIDQAMGTKLNTAKEQVPGLSGNVQGVVSQQGVGMGKLAIEACKARHLDPCDIGFVGAFAGSTFDSALRGGFNGEIAGRSNIHVVDTAESDFSVSVSLTAIQTMLQAYPSINVIVGEDQTMEAAIQAGVDPKKIALIGDGGSSSSFKGIKAGKWFGTIMSYPRTEGQDGAQCVIAAVQTGKNCGGINPDLAALNGGVVDQANASKFKSQWIG
jgi:ribose transport system substrate-binding protein